MSKSEGEDLISEKLPDNSLILRIPWAYGPNMRSLHHLPKLLESTRRGNLLHFINWPGRISLISVENLVLVLRNLIENHLNGIVHVYDEHQGDVSTKTTSQIITQACPEIL